MLPNSYKHQVDHVLDSAYRNAALLATVAVKLSLAEHNLRRHPISWHRTEGLKVGNHFWYEFYLSKPVHRTILEAGTYLDEMPRDVKRHLANYL